MSLLYGSSGSTAASRQTNLFDPHWVSPIHSKQFSSQTLGSTQRGGADVEKSTKGKAKVVTKYKIHLKGIGIE